MKLNGFVESVSAISSSTQRARLAALHVADTADAVDDGHVVAVAGLHLEQFGILAAGGLAGKGCLVADVDRVAGSRLTTRWFSTKTQGTRSGVRG